MDRSISIDLVPLPEEAAGPEGLPPLLYLDPALAEVHGLTLGCAVRLRVGRRATLVRLGPMLSPLRDTGWGAMGSDALPAGPSVETAVIERVEPPALVEVWVELKGQSDPTRVAEAIQDLAPRRLLLQAGTPLHLPDGTIVRIRSCRPEAGCLDEATEVRTEAPGDRGAPHVPGRAPRRSPAAVRPTGPPPAPPSPPASSLREGEVELRRLLEENDRLQAHLEELERQVKEAEAVWQRERGELEARRDRLAREAEAAASGGRRPPEPPGARAEAASRAEPWDPLEFLRGDPP